MKNRRRNEFLDIVKGVLITLVCVGHIDQYFVYQNAGFWSDPLFKAIYMFHMPLFMAVSGYLTFPGVNNATFLPAYVKRRVSAFLFPIFSWALLHQFVVFLLSGHLTFGRLFLEVTRITNVLYSQLWFLWALIGNIVVIAIVHSTGRYRYFALAISFVFVVFLPERSILHLFKYLYPFFVFGYCLKSYDINVFKFVQSNKLLVILFITSFICFLLWKEETYIYITKMTISSENIPNILFRWFASGIASVFIILLVYKLKQHIPVKVIKYFIFAGRNSLYVYVIQSALVMLIFQLSKKVFDPVSNFTYAAILSIFFGVCLTMVCLLLGSSIQKNRQLDRLLFG